MLCGRLLFMITSCYRNRRKGGAFEQIMSFLEQVYFQNTVLTYAIFLGVLLLGFVLIFVLGRVVLRRVAANNEKSQTPLGTFALSGIKRYLLPAAYFTAFYLSTRILTLNDTLTKIVTTISVLFVIFMAAMFLTSLAAYFFGKLGKDKDESGQLAVKWLVRIAKILIWALALILFLDNIGVKITSLVTGLGIGGVAIAFAAQNVLTDIFCFFTIFFDKPFELGDFIIAGEHMGTVEHIGIKTTRLRALGGEQLVVSNADLTGSRIRNYKTMERRRVLFTLGVTYDTPSEKLRQIPELIKQVVDGTENAEFARAHFASYGAYSLNVEVVYYVLTSDYDEYMNVNQRVNFGIMEGFENLGVSFAFPTTTVQMDSPIKP